MTQELPSPASHRPAYPREGGPIMGAQVSFLITEADTDGAMTQLEVNAAPGVGVPTHTHEHEDEAIIILRGKIRFVVNGQDFLATAGATVFAPRGCSHEWQVVGNEPARFLLTMTPGRIEGMYREILAQPHRQHDRAFIRWTSELYGVHFD
jgi:quercetin dioxygenase-like cupin family protein